MAKNPINENAKKRIRIAFLVVVDILCVNLAMLLALYFCEECNIQTVLFSDYMSHITIYAFLNTIVTIAIFVPFKLYRSLWQYAGVDELMHIVVAGAITTLLNLLANLLLPVWFPGYAPFPASYPVVSGMFLVGLVGLSRLAYRAIRSYFHPGNSSGKVRTLLVGGGSAGAMALREFQTSEQSHNDVVCIVDDDFSKRGDYLRGVKIIGNRFDIVGLVEKYGIKEIVLAIPAASASDRRAILNICQQTKCKLKTLPGLYQLANEEVSLKKIRDVDVLDLLGRESVEVDLKEINGYLQDKVILVTGGGGSIGSELCRQIAKSKPKQLIILDIYENNAYEIQQELKKTDPELDLVVRIGSVRDTERINSLFDELRPQIVFHAAAHKHVPLMEDSPNEAIKNNVFGTLHVARAANRYGAERFVLISTDKAVNPTNIMGASKRICEMIVQTMAANSETKYAAVRFGNVLGSNGSVIPLFKKQIDAGGPVTVTHKDIIRYFMTIPEAVSLVLQAGAFAGQGEIFVLDMGDPVRIDDLARNMIRLSGLEPDVDIKIEYTGLRPGEKLYEEMLMQEEGLRTTANKLIHIGRPLEINEEVFDTQLQRLYLACEHNSEDIKEVVADIVDTYRLPKPVG